MLITYPSQFLQNMCPTGYLRSFGIIILFVTPGNSEYQKCKHLEKHSTEDMGIRNTNFLENLYCKKKKETSQNVTTIKEIIAALGHHKTSKQSYTLQNFIGYRS